LNHFFIPPYIAAMEKQQTNSRPVVLLTGAAGGIGSHFVEANRGRFRFVATDVDESALIDHLGEETDDFLPLRHDVSRAAHWEAVFDACLGKFGRMDYLINNAGMIRPKFVLDAHAGHVEEHLDVNAKGVLLGTTLGAQIMHRQEGGGHIINIISLAGITPAPGIAYYAASKFAARGFSLSAAMELRPHGIFVTSICPDLVKTPMYDLQLDTPREAALSFSGGPRPLYPADVEKAILKAMRSKALEITLPVSRGWLAKLAAAFPKIALYLHRTMERRGLKQLESIRTVT